MLGNFRVSNLNEALDVGGIISNQAVTKGKYIHALSRQRVDTTQNKRFPIISDLKT
jgi:hypothetical protein